MFKALFVFGDVFPHIPIKLIQQRVQFVEQEISSHLWKRPASEHSNRLACPKVIPGIRAWRHLHGGTAAQRHSGTAAQRHSGTAAQRHSGTAAQRHSGTAAQRHSGTAAQRHSGTAAQRHSGTAAQPAQRHSG